MSHLRRMVNNQYKGKITWSGEEEKIFRRIILRFCFTEMEVYVVNITNIPKIFNGVIEIRQVPEITAEETLKKEEFSDDECFKIESDMQEEIKSPEDNDPEKCTLTDSDFEWIKSLKEKTGGPKKRIPFSCNHCEFIGNNVAELRKHKRDLDSYIFFSWTSADVR